MTLFLMTKQKLVQVGLLTLHGHMDPTNSLPFNSVGDTVGQLDLPEVLRSSGHEFYK